MEPEPERSIPLHALPLSKPPHHTDMNQDTKNTLEVPDFFRDTVNKNSLCASVGHRIFCPHCDTVMDWKRAVGASAWKGEKCVSIHVACTDCWDRCAPTVTEKVSGLGMTLELIDGRELRKRMP